MSSHPKAVLGKHKVLVEGIKTVVRTASALRDCDACTKDIIRGEKYVRVQREEHKNWSLEIFHVECFLTEFTDWEGRK